MEKINTGGQSENCKVGGDAGEKKHKNTGKKKKGSYN